MNLREYILQVITTAILCALMQVFFDKDSSLSAIMKLVTGLIMTVTLLTPLLRKDIQVLDIHPDSISLEKESIVTSGKLAARNYMEQSIIQRTTTYILDEADALGADIQVEVQLADTELPVPEAVRISGTISPYAKTKLKNWIERELGISEDKQTWN